MQHALKESLLAADHTLGYLLESFLLLYVLIHAAPSHSRLQFVTAALPLQTSAPSGSCRRSEYAFKLILPIGREAVMLVQPCLIPTIQCCRIVLWTVLNRVPA